MNTSTVAANEDNIQKLIIFPKINLFNYVLFVSMILLLNHIEFWLSVSIG